MAVPEDFKGSTHHFGPPPGQEDKVGWLHVFHNGHCAVSAWRPTKEELEALNRGEPIFMSMWTGSSVDFVKVDGVVQMIERPVVYPCFVGTESQTKLVVAQTGDTW